MSATAAVKARSHEAGLRLVIDAGRDPVSGLPRLSLAAGRTKATAALTVRDFIEGTYLPALEIRKPTIEDYAYTLRTFVLPRLGDEAIDELTPHGLDGFFATLKRAGASDQQRAHVYRVFRAALRRAALWRLIDASPMFGVRPPRPAPRDVNPLSRDEANAYLDAFEDHPVELAVVLALSAGLRLSEIAALRWSDIDLETNVVRIRRAARHVTGGVVIQQPKSARSRRDVSLPAWAIARIVARLAEREADDIFAMQPKAISGSYRRHVRLCGLRAVPFRDLRHSHATLLLAAGSDIVTVSRRLGHQSVATTDAFYLAPGRAADKLAAEKAETIRDVVGGSSS